MATEAKAVLRHLRMAPRKVRDVVNLVRGKQVGEAMTILKFTPRRAARVVEKVLKSVIANAVQREVGDADELWVSKAYVDQGTTLKRVQPAPRGMAHPIKKRTSHITLVVSAKSAGRSKG